MKILLLDIETAPHKVYVWGLWQQNVALNQIEEAGYTLCWAAKWYGDKQIMFSSVNDGREKMLRKIYSLVEEADVVVHFNGAKFDMPTLNKEWLALGWTPPAPYLQIDLYSVAKKRFRFPSNKLSYISDFLEIGEKVNHKGMELWRECMEGNKSSWKIMEAYNKQDVNLLEELYDKLLAWIPNHPNKALWTDREEMLCPTCGSHALQKRGFHYTKSMVYQRYRCNDCGVWSKERTSLLSKEKRKVILTGVG